MTFWQWYWIWAGLFCWGVFGLVAFMIVWSKVSKMRSDLYSSMFVILILPYIVVLAGPFVWIFTMFFVLNEVWECWRDRRNY